MAEHHLAQALRAHLRPDRDNDDHSDNHDADDCEVDDARLQVREQLRHREWHGHVHADDGRVQHVEAEQCDRHCATDADRYGHLRATDAERHRKGLLHEIETSRTKSGDM